jgi:DinB superfamily
MVPMDLRTWITGEHDAVLARFEQSVASAVPLERWRDPGGPGGSSIAWLAFHTSYHEDLAVNAVLGGASPVIEEWRDGLGIAGVPADVGLGETEQPSLTDELDVDRLVAYLHAVHARTAEWLADVDLAALEVVPASGDGLDRAGVEERAAPWLYRMWDGKPGSWFVQWEAIGHRVNHVGEMVSVRNRLGLSPF